jgi:HEAT repeat protein
MTPDARASDYVAYEWAFAIGAGVRIVPVRLKAAPFHPRLDELQHVDFTGRQRPWEDLLQQIEKLSETQPTTTRTRSAGTPPTVRRAVAALDSPDAEQQMLGVQSLADTDHPAARDALARALEHPTKTVRMTAAIKYPDPKDPRIITGLMDAAQSNDFLRKWYSGTNVNFESWIANIGPPAVPKLLDVLRNPNSGFRWRAVEILGRLGDKRALPDLVDALGDKDSIIRKHSVRALGKIGDANEMSYLVNALGDEAEDVRAEAATALGEIGHNAVTELVAALEDESTNVRTAAAEALGKLKARAAVPNLLEHLSNDNSKVREVSALALGRIGDPAALALLVEVFQEELGEYLGLRRKAVQALGLLGDSDAVDVLGAYLTHRQQTQELWKANELDIDVAEALLKLKCTDAIDLVGKVLYSHLAGTQSFGMVELLGSFGDKAVPVLIDLLTHRHVPFQEACAKILKKVGTEEALAAVEKWRRAQ